MTQGNKKPNKEMAAGFAARLRQFVGPREKSTFGAKVGVSGEMISQYLDGSLPLPDVLYEISRVTGRTMEWFLTGRENADATPNKYANLPEKILRHVDKLITILQSSDFDTHVAIAENLNAFVKSIEHQKTAEEQALIVKQTKSLADAMTREKQNIDQILIDLRKRQIEQDGIIDDLKSQLKRRREEGPAKPKTSRRAG